MIQFKKYKNYYLFLSQLPIAQDKFCNSSVYIVNVKKCNKKMKIEPRHEKTNVVVSVLVRHKPGCTATVDG